VEVAGERVLVVDDEPTVREVVQWYLEHHGYQVELAGDGAGALDAFTAHVPDLVVLDLMLPGVDGLEVCRRIRAASATPVIMLTAKGHEADRIVGLELGADDYLVKPFSPRELVARVRSVLRRTLGNGELARAQPLRVGDVSVDPATREVSVAGRALALTAREFDLLAFLVRHPRQVFTRGQLLRQVWEYTWVGDDTSTVTVHVRRLREKLEEDPSNPVRVQTVYGVGYRFVPREPGGGDRLP
jgi:DNA-binding response OmpR family regulator